jgi:Leucine-rich repeat (LRR) protein
MSDLESLDLFFNKNLHTFPPAACAAMKKLKELPAELGAMSDLESLNLSFNKNLHNFPPAACAGMKKLKVLDLSYCNIKELPAELGAMSESLGFEALQHQEITSETRCNESLRELEFICSTKTFTTSHRQHVLE